MEIIDTTKDKKKKQWQLGDVLRNKHSGEKGLIVKDNDGNYCLINITENCDAYTYTTEHSNKYSSFGYFILDYEKQWQKVNAKLVID